MSEPRSEIDLIAAAKNGDSTALARLMRVYRRRLLCHLKPRMPVAFRGVLDAEDVVEHSVCEVLTSIQRCRAESPTEFFAWLKAIGEHCLRDTVRTLSRKRRGGGRRQIRQSPELTDGHAFDVLEGGPDGKGDNMTPSRVVARKEAAAEVRVAIEALPDLYQKIVRLSLQEKGSEEIANVVGKTPAAVRAILHRARQMMREKLASESHLLSKR